MKFITFFFRHWNSWTLKSKLRQHKSTLFLLFFRSLTASRATIFQIKRAVTNYSAGHRSRTMFSLFFVVYLFQLGSYMLKSHWNLSHLSFPPFFQLFCSLIRFFIHLENHPKFFFWLCPISGHFFLYASDTWHYLSAHFAKSLHRWQKKRENFYF